MLCLNCSADFSVSPGMQSEVHFLLYLSGAITLQLERLLASIQLVWTYKVSLKAFVNFYLENK